MILYVLLYKSYIYTLAERNTKMYKEISQLIMYGNLDNSSILSSMADIFNRFDNKLSSKEELVTDIYTQVKRILEVATDYGFR